MMIGIVIGKNCFVLNMLLINLTFFGLNLGWAHLFGRVFLGLFAAAKNFYKWIPGNGQNVAF